MQYNGHKNWNHWNVSLWINNEEGLYTFARECVRDNKNRTDAARVMLDDLHANGIIKTPDGAPYTLSSVRAAMEGM
jgi:hypothetical protein